MRSRMPVALLALSLWLLSGPGPSDAHARADAAAGSIFQIVVVAHEGPAPPKGQWKSVARGTAFFVSSDGTAVTNSHVIFRAQRDPDRYHLVAIVGAGLYSARLVCASVLDGDPASPPPGGVTFQRDVAEVEIVPLALWGLPSWGYTEYGTFHPVAAAHRGRVPRFQPLVIADGVTAGDRVHVVGFGFQSILIRPRLWTADGVVSRVYATADGTEVFEVESTLRPQPGHSGSPVFNEAGHVVGLWTWSSRTHANLGTAQTNAVLAHPCL
jgi:hypothetical protein